MNTIRYGIFKRDIQGRLNQVGEIRATSLAKAEMLAFALGFISFEVVALPRIIPGLPLT